MGKIGLLAAALAPLSLILGLPAVGQPMRAVFLQDAFTSGNYSSVNSEAALTLYKKMGYNTVFEQINPPPSPGDWNMSSSSAWTISNTAARNALVDRMRAQNERLKALGMDYCPFFSPWGWDVGTIPISERMREAVYRSVPFTGGYGSGVNYYSTLTKTTGAYDEPAKVYWNGTSSVTIEAGITASSNAATVNMVRSSAVTNTELTTGQCYKFEAQASIPAGNPLLAGDEFSLTYFQIFTQQPDASFEPLGKLFTNRNCALGTINYKVIAANGGAYAIQNRETKDMVCPSCTTFPISLTVWIEDSFPFGFGHSFINNVFWDLQLRTSDSRTVASQINISNFKITRVDPTTQLAYPNWETNSAASYPSEYATGMRTKATYKSIGLPVQYMTVNYFPVTPRYAWDLIRIDGHFMPTGEGLGWTYFRKSLDPLSPPYDLISTEMLKVIKDGLNGQEPKYFHMNGDEAMVFRRDNASRMGGPNSAYNSVSNGGFYARVIEKNLNRYKQVYGIPSGMSPTARFPVWGDMFLTYGMGYALYANANMDASAIEYWKSQNLQDLIRPNIWIYDEMRVLGLSPPQFLLNRTSDVQNSILPLTGNGFRFSAAYSTWATLTDIKAVDGTIDTDEKHIQHEINMAKKWWDIVRTTGNFPSFDGFIYPGWDSDLRTNAWNGLYSTAYFGWVNPTASDLPAAWKTKAATNDYKNQPRLDHLNRNVWVPVDILPAIHSLLQ